MDYNKMKEGFYFWLLGMIAVLIMTVFNLTGKPAVFTGVFAGMIWIVASATMIQAIFKKEGGSE